MEGLQGSILCLKNSYWMASLNEMWSQGRGGEVVGAAVEL